MSLDQSDFGSYQQPAADKPKPEPTKRKTRTAAEQLADLRKRERNLRQRIEKQIDKSRLDLVEKLYSALEIERSDDDLEESERLDQLRTKLETALAVNLRS